MTQTCEALKLKTPARRRRSQPLPVLISIPNLSVPTRSPRPRVRRRRLRREVRVLGSALLVILPLAIAFLTLGGDKLPRLAARVVVESPAASPELSIAGTPRISLAPLEPIVSLQSDLDAPVILPGYLLPADAAEESTDGGH